jgi:uncharacterized cofD-like protein
MWNVTNANDMTSELDVRAAGPGGGRPTVAPTRARRTGSDVRSRPATPQTAAEPFGPWASTATPKVAALGGGHGLSVTLQAARLYAGTVSGVVSIADDGGSSGRLRHDYGAVPPGDIRRCLVALAGEDDTWSDVFQYRFAGGELDDHALGNLILVGLAETLGSFDAAVRAAEELLHAVGRVFPATVSPVVLTAMSDEGTVVGQQAINATSGLKRLELLPADPIATPQAVAAILEAEHVVLAPGSLFTSILPVVCVPEISTALQQTKAHVIHIGNLAAEAGEAEGLDAADHVRIILDHGARIDTYIADPKAPLPLDAERIAEWGVKIVQAPVARLDGAAHAPEAVARTLRSLV